MATEVKIGRITHYFDHVHAAVIELTDGDLKVGDTIRIKGHTTNFEEHVTSLQWDHKPVTEGKKGTSVALEVKERVRIHDDVFKIIAD